jgi:hypothetical protein
MAKAKKLTVSMKPLKAPARKPGKPGPKPKAKGGKPARQTTRATPKDKSIARAAQRFEEGLQPFHVRMPVALHRRLRFQALRDGVSAQELVIRALEATLDELPRNFGT